MVFLQRSAPINPRKRPAPPPPAPLEPQSQPKPSIPFSAASKSSEPSKSKLKSTDEDDGDHVGTMMSLLADAGCTLCVASGAPPSLPSDPLKLRRSLEARFSSDPSLLSRFVIGFSSYIQVPQNLKRVLTPAAIDGGSARGESLVRLLLLVGPAQVQIQQLLLEKLPEHFDAVSPSRNLNDDVARLIVNQFRWLDFLVDSRGFAEKLMEVLSIAPLLLKKEIIGSLPEIIGDQNSSMVIASLERLLQEDSEVIVPVLDSFSNLNLDDQLQEQAVTIALSCIRTVDAEHMPHLLRFLLLSATSVNVGRIISQIREQLKFVGVSDPCVAKQKMLKGKYLADSTEASILDALRSSLRFKNTTCEAIFKELKSLDHPRDHKVIDVWFLMLIYTNGGSLQKNAEKILKKKIIDGYFCEALFDQCIHGQRELVRDYFSSFLSVCEFLLACKEKQAREFGIYLYKLMFEEFSDTFARQEVLGALVTHIGSGVTFEVSSALDTLILLTSKYSGELLPISSHINGILDYLEGFHEENLHKVYEVFCHLALSSRSYADPTSSSIENELLMIIRKQVSNSDMMYRKMGIIGTLKIVSTLGDINATTTFPPSQESNCQEALELLRMSFDSCKTVTSPLVLLYDGLIVLLDQKTLKPAIIEWLGKHVGEFESLFLCDLEESKLPLKDSSNGIEGDLWMNLDGDVSPICLDILRRLSSPSQKSSSSLQILPCEFLLLSAIERLTNQGSLGGIDALLGCPLHLPSPKYLIGGHWKNLTGQQKQIVCFSLYYAINWIRELLNAFITQVNGRVDCISQATRRETKTKLLKRLRNLVLMECLLDASLQFYPLSLPELHNFVEHPGSPLASNANHSMQREKRNSERMMSDGGSQNKRRKKKDPGTSEKSIINEKLKQPTILDAFKRAGVVVSQEVNESSPGHSSNGMSSQGTKNQDSDSNEVGPIDISAEFKVLNAQRFKFRPLLVDCLSMLSFSEVMYKFCAQKQYQESPTAAHDAIRKLGNSISTVRTRFVDLTGLGHDSCCSDPAAELPLHLYLLRDFHNKLDYLNPPSKQFVATCSVKASPGYCRVTTCEFLSKIRPLFPSLKKHLDVALSILGNGSDTCEEHWKTHSFSAGNPDVPNLVVSIASAASSVFREVLCCYSKMLSLPVLFHQSNQPILRDMLEAFQPIMKPDNFVSSLNPAPTAGNIDYLYCGVYSMLEGVLETACSSFLLASEVLFTQQSLINSMALLIENNLESNGKNIHTSCCQRALSFLKSGLGLSAHKLLVHNWASEDNEISGKNKGDILQKVLQIHLKNSESTSDLLGELACSILPQVPSCKTRNTQETAYGFPTLCPTMFLTWCRVVHEENLEILNKLVKGAILKSRGNVRREAVKDVLVKLRQSVNVVVSLVNMCKVHDKVAMHAMAVKYGGKFVDTFLKVFNFLQVHFQAHNDIIIQLVKELQKATRIIQTLCSEAKGLKRTMVTSKIPATKRSMERFLFHVKALLHNTSNGCTFWMGNLKHKDLYGQVVSSQVYANGDDEAVVEEEAHMQTVEEEQYDGSAREDDEN